MSNMSHTFSIYFEFAAVVYLMAPVTVYTVRCARWLSFYFESIAFSGLLFPEISI